MTSWLPNDGMYKGWLKRVKSDKAQYKFLQNTTSRYYTVDFRNQVFFYSHSEAQKDRCQIVAFKDLKASALSRSSKTGFFVETAERTYELHASSTAFAAQWVEILESARELAIRHGGSSSVTTQDSPARTRVGASSSLVSSPIPDSPWSPELCGRGAGVRLSLDEVDESYAERLVRGLRGDLRVAASGRCSPPWIEMTWVQRLAVVYEYCRETGLPPPCDEVYMSSSSPDPSPSPVNMGEGLRRRHQLSVPGPPPVSTFQPDHHVHGLGATPSFSSWEPDYHQALVGHTPASAIATPPADLEERCRHTLFALPNDVRTAAAKAYELTGLTAWGKLTWAARYVVVRDYCARHGHHCDIIPSVDVYAPAAIQQQALHGRHPPPPLDTVGLALPPSTNGHAQRANGHAFDHMSMQPAHDAHHGNGSDISIQPSNFHGLGQTDLHSPGAEKLRLKAIFSTTDSLQLLLKHHLETLGQAVADSMQTRKFVGGEVAIEEGSKNRCMYIVDKGCFHHRYAWDNGQPIKTYSDGAVFGEMAMAEGKEAKGRIVAAQESSVWYIDRDTFHSILKAPADSKTIGLVGGVMLLINNLAGPTIQEMPGFAQEAGWLSIILVQVVVAAFAWVCGHMIITAMQRMPGNHNFEQRIEFSNLLKFYLADELYWIVMACCIVCLICQLMQLIIQSSIVIDLAIAHMFGCTPALELPFSFICGMAQPGTNDTLFGADQYVLSLSMFLVAVVCAPFALKNLDDNVILQYVAVVGLVVMAFIWIVVLIQKPDFPQPLPLVTSQQRPLISTVITNFAFVSTLPSWVNEKRPEVSVNTSFGLTMVFVVVLYSIIGVIGGMAYKPFFQIEGMSIFVKLHEGSTLAKVSVDAYPILQNFTSIPVCSVLIRYNLEQSGMFSGRFGAILLPLIAIVLPWALCIFYYTGDGINSISDIGMGFSLVVNFLVPIGIYVSIKLWYGAPKQ